MNRDEQKLLEEKYGGFVNPHFEEDCKRLAVGEPLAYVIGWQPFLGLKIYLDSHPLIPRSETEWWTEQLLGAFPGALHRSTDRAGGTFSAENDSVPGKRTQQLRFLDLCAGSGAVGCAALKSLPYMEVFFCEIDPAHETTIRKNIRENGLDESRASIGIGDLFEPFGDMKFDVIAVNPPYIPAGRALPESVADYEPARALYAGADGLELIRRIAEVLPKHLAENGQVWVECDSAHAATACALFTAQGLNAEIRTDQYDVPRIVVVSFP